LNQSVRVLMIDDDDEDVFLVRTLIKEFVELEVVFEQVSDYEQARQAIVRAEHDLYLVDFRLGAKTGLDLIQESISDGIDVPFILLTGFGSRDLDRTAMKIGASEYLPKADLSPIRLERVMLHSIDRFRTLSELKRANKDKTMFLARMSHEIRTPLAGIIGIASLLGETALDKDQQDYAHLIDSSCQALLGLINDILDFSKIESGKINVEQTPFDLRNAIQESLTLATFTSSKKNIDVIKRWSPGMPEIVIGDPLRLRQVLLNLLNNSLKFTEFGEVVLRASLDRQEAETAWVRFEVVDTGIGMSEEEQQNIFKSFSQANQSTSRKYGGTGLGLPICKNLVELMGGELLVKSQKGHGSNFYFSMPFKLLANHQERQGLKPLGKHSVLIVVNGENNREALLEQCVALNLEAIVETGADPALERLRAAKVAGKPFRFLLLDKFLQDADSFALGKMIKADLTLHPIDIVLLTYLGDTDHELEYSACGISAHLAKPTSATSLHQAFSNILEPTDEEKVSLIGRPEAAPNFLQGNKKYILLADDNTVIQTIMVRLLKRMGYIVDVAQDGHEAVAAVKKKKYDLILMDCEMPNLNGFDASKSIRELPSDTRLPIIAVTAHPRRDVEEKCLAMGMDDIITKPVEQLTLQKLLQEWIK